MDLAFSLLRDKFRKHQAVPPVLMFMDQSNGAFPLLQKLADLHTSSIIPSFNVLPLGDLLRLFQNHEATDKRDKIYALLGLSSDNDNSPNLRPDYTKSWATLFRQVITHILGASPVASTWDNKEHAVIIEMGSVLGTVSKGLSNTMTVVSPVFGRTHKAGYNWRASWTISHDAGSIQHGDILVFFQNARRPSLIRPCGDHFDIVMISLPPPPVVIVEKSPRTNSWEDIHVPWNVFQPGIRRSTKKFNLVWDWVPDHDHSPKAHEALLNSTESPCSSSTERRFNTVRVLDILSDFAGMAALLKDRPSPADFGPMEKHLILLDHVLVHWIEYLHMKQYFAIIHWCIWSLHAPINLDYLLDYWHCAGPLTSDLFSITEFAEANLDRVAQLTGGYRFIFGKIEGWEYVLYPLIFPTYSPPMPYDGDAANSHSTLSPHNEHYLMRLVLASQTSFECPSEGVLERLYQDPALDDKFHFIIIMLLEHGSTSLNEGHAVQLATQRLDLGVNYQLLDILLCELAHNPVATFFLLSSFLRVTLPEDFERLLWAKVLEPNLKAVVHQFRNLLLCELEIGLWISANGPFDSVLCYLHLYLRRFDPTWDDEETNLSLHNTARWYSTEALVRWAHRALIDAISYHKRRRERPRYVHRGRRYSTESDESSTSSQTLYTTSESDD